MALAIKQTRVVEVPVVELRACIEQATIATLLDADGLVVGQSTTPSWLPTVIHVDLETGRIVNWQAPTGEQLQAMADGHAPVLIPSEIVAPAVTLPEPVIKPVDLPADHGGELEAESPLVLDHGQVSVYLDSTTGKWTAQTPSPTLITNILNASSSQTKFDAIKGVLKKAGKQGVFEVNHFGNHGEQEIYAIDGSRTQDADTVYLTQKADGWTAKTPNNRPVSGDIGLDGELRALLQPIEDIQPDEAVIVETTDDEMRAVGKRRYAVTAKSEHVAANPDQIDMLADHPEAPVVETPVAVEDIGGRGPVKPRYQSPTGETWTGRGKQPTWLQAEIANGANIDDFLIDASQKPIAIPELTPPANPNNTPPSYDELVMAINHASTVNQAAALVGRISKHPNFSQQQSLYALQRKRVDALKSAEQST
jgi:DNA-binding protein H-NS